ncbi:hypothetical protein PV08_01851 [Exophiala spinifera]|uniref:RRM domain-containing protein n=1 Tax=Exophiala spinifera TaxID=91928 RepID=A0A0D1Z0V7_9EURO|nr:uncharacterized protein PV08_01851 [Exophiala spinifera]KIW21271.1 hypothetical protein PV08_01851 [Exophiala spinifera]
MPREQRRARDVNRDDEQYIILVQDIPRHCRWQELKDMTRSLGGEQSLKAEVFATSDGSQLGHCTIKGRSAATQVYENFCVQGWNGKCVRVSLAVLEKPGILKTLEGPRKSRGATVETRVSPSFGHHPPPAGLTGSQTGSSCLQVYPNTYQFEAMSSQNQFYQRPTPARTAIVPSHASAGASRAPPSTPVAQVSPYSYPTRTISYPTVSAAMTYSPALVGAHSRQHSAVASKPSSLVSIDASRRDKSPNTILISRLPPQQSEKELRSLLEQYGSLVYLDIGPKTPTTEKAKGTANARFGCAAEAEAAVQGLNGCYLGGCKIKLRQEKPERTLSSRPGGKPTMPSPGREISIAHPTAVQSPHEAFYQMTQGKADRDTGNTGSSSPLSGPLIVDGARCLCTGAEGGYSAETQDDDSSDDDSDSSDEGEEKNNDDDDDVARTSDRVSGMKM